MVLVFGRRVDGLNADAVRERHGGEMKAGWSQWFMFVVRELVDQSINEEGAILEIYVNCSLCLLWGQCFC